MFKAGAKVWFNRYALQKPLYSRLSYQMKKTSQNRKRAYLARWIHSSKPALERVKKAKRLNACLNKIDKRRLLIRWVNEINFLIRLSNTEAHAIQLFNTKRASKAIQKFSAITQARIFQRQMGAQTRDYAEKKLKSKVYMQLFHYKSQRIEQRHKKIHAQAFHDHNLLLKGVRALSRNYIRSV